MDVKTIISLLNAVASLIPEITQIIPIVDTLLSGEKVTSAQAAQLWSVISQLETWAVQRADVVTNTP